MRYTRILIGFGAAAIIFMGLFYALQTRYNLFVSLQNPFVEKAVPESASIGEEGEQKVFQSSEGELLIVYPGATTEITEEKRELIEGGMFLSGVLVSLDLLGDYLVKDVFLRHDTSFGAAGGQGQGLPAIGSP